MITVFYLVIWFLREGIFLTISMQRALEILNEQKNGITLDELMFVLTVFRDNAEHDDVYEFLDTVVKGNFGE